MKYHLSTNFFLHEATNNDIAKINNIKNIVYVDTEIEKNLCNLAKNILEPLRNYFNTAFSPITWYKSKELCQFLKEDVNNPHTTGEAVTLTIPGYSVDEVYTYVRNNLIYNKLKIINNDIIYIYYKNNKA